ncbi:MAG: hypothetical protein IAE87_01755 [Rhodobacteraceae bacterium]|nr:hypothetical protein [Paracoccaceae bacterium]
MPVLLILLLAGVVVFLWLTQRNSTLTRDCRWRLDRATAPGHWRCAACGAECDLAVGQEPRDCLRVPRG